eukprot:Plantae.Rhodophyta-Palmaria_palmata.ctg27141.p1 GENE.Plantae.Rhodophyta-Palmaria_palmata.ctg27141~~Plantae.Rhodophyta-Palmaria_palmata.ctg27141.p1  ORF type:complete len:100 (+),score=7.19 Plantae.Rhodophyta-Palmaria_palmata.ctg27141:32-331(+)
MAAKDHRHFSMCGSSAIVSQALASIVCNRRSAKAFDCDECGTVFVNPMPFFCRKFFTFYVVCSLELSMWILSILASANVCIFLSAAMIVLPATDFVFMV